MTNYIPVSDVYIPQCIDAAFVIIIIIFVCNMITLPYTQYYVYCLVPEHIVLRLFINAQYKGCL